MYNDYLIFLLVLNFFLILISLFNYKIIAIIMLNIELCWIFFFFFNIYSNAFIENPILNFLNIWLLCFSTLEIIVFVLILNFFKK